MVALGLVGLGGKYGPDFPQTSSAVDGKVVCRSAQAPGPPKPPEESVRSTDPDLQSLLDIRAAIGKRSNEELSSNYEGHGPSCATISCVCPLGNDRYLVKESWSDIGGDGCLDVFSVKGDEARCLFGFASAYYSEPKRFRTMRLPDNFGDALLCEVWVATRRGNYTYHLYSIGETEALELATVWMGGNSDGDRYDAMYADIDHDGDSDILIYDKISGTLKTAFKWSTSFLRFEQTK